LIQKIKTERIFFSALRSLACRLPGCEFAKWKSALKTLGSFDQSTFRIKRVLANANLNQKEASTSALTPSHSSE
jgi:hypothetical protein